MPTLALIGYPLSHSFSKQYFEEKFEQLNLTGWRYELLPMEDVGQLLEVICKQKDLVGLNVTIPHKINIIPLCNSLSEEADAIGAVNCVKIEWVNNEPQLTGFNTDVFGFEKSLKDWYQSTINRAIIYGNGGAARAVQYVLRKLGIPFIQVVRNIKNENHVQWDAMTREMFSQHDLVINCTPVGTSPKTEEVLNIEGTWIKPFHHFYDLVYNPAETATMQLFTQQGASAKNGLEMLHLQADKAWEIWNNDLL